MLVIGQSYVSLSSSLGLEKVGSGGLEVLIFCFWCSTYFSYSDSSIRKGLRSTFDVEDSWPSMREVLSGIKVL